MENFFKDFTKRKLIAMLCVLCLHPANAKIIRGLQNTSYKEFLLAIKEATPKEAAA